MTYTKDYAFASGGIVWKIFDRSKFESRSLRHQIYRLLLLILACWLPIAILSFVNLGWNSFYQLFLKDVATHVRFLIVLPILLLSRRSVNKSFNDTISFFHETKIIDAGSTKAFETIMDWLKRWSNSKIIDGLLLVVVYSAFFFQENNQINHTNTYAPWHMVDGHITAAGWWYLLISLPLLQMLLYRWLYTIILWILFLRKISKLDLHLSALHPDGVGGLGFLQYTQLAFFPVALAFSSLAAGVLNNIIMFSGISIRDYKVAIGSVLIFVFLLFIFPLLLLTSVLSKVKKRYFMLYSKEAWPFARKYEEELAEYYKTEEEKPDASWHIDLIGSFEKTRDMKIFLVDKTMLITFISAVVLPFIPVIAQQIPVKEILIDVLGKIMG